MDFELGNPKLLPDPFTIRFDQLVSEFLEPIQIAFSRRDVAASRGTKGACKYESCFRMRETLPREVRAGQLKRCGFVPSPPLHRKARRHGGHCVSIEYVWNDLNCCRFLHHAFGLNVLTC